MNTDNENQNGAAPVAGAVSELSEPKREQPAQVESIPEAMRPDPVVAERDQLKDQLLRTAADFDNFRKRARREMEDAKLRGRDDAIKEVLPVFDNLERAVAAADSAQSVASVVEGVKMVLKLFQDTSERMGINRVTTVGQRFDPQLHEAIQQKETDEFPPGTIITEVVPGYLVGQRLLRAAMVVVARKPAPPPPSEPKSPETKSSDAEGAPPTPAAASGDAGSDGTPA